MHHPLQQAKVHNTLADSCRRSLGRHIRMLLWITVMLVAAAPSAIAQQTTASSTAPSQPIPFSHRKHVGINLPCSFCHTNPDHGASITFPPVSTCMTCHASVAKDKPAIQTLSGIAASGKQVPWVQVYGVPSFVFWSHDVHQQAKVQCSDCHGDVAAMDVLFRATDVTTMGGCVACHKQRNGPTGCMSCHESQSSRLLLEPLPASLRRLVNLPADRTRNAKERAKHG